MAAYLQILSLGTLWIIVHCAPMCGPIVVGLRLSGPTFTQTGFQLMSYQGGRVIVLGTIGAMVGAIGENWQTDLHIFGWLVVGVLGLMAVVQWLQFFLPRLDAQRSFTAKVSLRLSSLLSSALAHPLVSERSPLLRGFFLGLIFSLLPCMLMGWALTVAASTGSAIHGFGVMSLLVVMTTLPLALVLLGVQPFRRFRVAWIEPLLLTISWVWTILMTLGAQGLIPHLHFNFNWAGEHYHLMFW